MGPGVVGNERAVVILSGGVSGLDQDASRAVFARSTSVAVKENLADRARRPALQALLHADAGRVAEAFRLLPDVSALAERPSANAEELG